MTVFPLNKKLSILVPVLNEEESVSPFIDTITPIIAPLVQDYEIIFISDGCTDNTIPLLRQRQQGDAHIRVIELSRNFGKEAALAAGLDFCTGDACVPMDVDLQDNPAALPLMLEKWHAGFEIVYAARRSRAGDGFFKRVSAQLYYWMLGQIATSSIPYDVGDYRLIDRVAIDVLKNMPERTRFMRGLSSWIGFKQCAVEFARGARAHGTTKYSIRKMVNFALDGITGFSTLPLRAVIYLGIFVSSLSFVYLLAVLVDTLINGRDSPGYASLMVVILFLGGVQLIALGVIGEYLGRVFHETKRRPIYIARPEQKASDNN